MTFGEIESFFETNDNFRGWRIGSFGYELLDYGKQNIKIELYGSGSSVSNFKRKVEIRLFDVTEVRSDFLPGQGSVVLSGVRFSLSEIGGYCIEIDGNFDGVPITLDSIRRRSDCYAIGKAVDIKH
ncbi:hypothetical protein [Pseudomonas sp. NPDC089401]|uniref:hypothetical protein n=1 Tax=Pseudomonas sp. NPDC089401 TaxID=3364462 RepID=UPI0038224588